MLPYWYFVVGWSCWPSRRILVVGAASSPAAAAVVVAAVLARYVQLLLLLRFRRGNPGERDTTGSITADGVVVGVVQIIVEDRQHGQHCGHAEINRAIVPPGSDSSSQYYGFLRRRPLAGRNSERVASSYGENDEDDEDDNGADEADADENARTLHETMVIVTGIINIVVWI